MDPLPSKFNKISDVVRLQHMLKKWKKLARANKGNGCNTPSNSFGRSRSFSFIRRTLSFGDGDADFVPKGCLAVCVGKELKRYIIPTEYLAHQAFGELLTEAEEEFGFQQEGVLKFPCQVAVFERILKVVELNKVSSDA